MLCCTHVKPQHRIFRPLLFQLFNGQPLEQLLSALEIALQRRNQQRLTEPPRATQENVIAYIHHLVDILSLVNIEISTLNEFGECLYAYWQPFQLLRFHVHVSYTLANIVFFYQKCPMC